MLDRLDVVNFKAFADARIPLGGVTLLSGLNSAGKSTVLQALALLRQSQVAGLLDDGKGTHGAPPVRPSEPRARRSPRGTSLLVVVATPQPRGCDGLRDSCGPLSPGTPKATPKRSTSTRLRCLAPCPVPSRSRRRAFPVGRFAG